MKAYTKRVVVFWSIILAIAYDKLNMNANNQGMYNKIFIIYYTKKTTHNLQPFKRHQYRNRLIMFVCE